MTVIRYSGLVLSVHKIQWWYQRPVFLSRLFVGIKVRFIRWNKFFVLNPVHVSFLVWVWLLCDHGGKLVWVDGTKIEWLNDVNCHMWKRGISYLLILDKISYTMTTNKTYREDFAFQKLKDNWEENNYMAKAALLSFMHDVWFLLFKECKMKIKFECPRN